MELSKSASNEIQYLRPDEVQKIFKIPLSTQKALRHIAKTQKEDWPIPFVKRGRSVLYKLSELELWLHNQNQQGGESK